MEKGRAVEVQERDGDEGTAAGAAGVRDDGEEEEHEDRRDDAWGDELADGVGSEGAHGVDLLGDLHGAKLGGHAGGVTTRDHEASEYGAELLDHGERDEAAGHVDGAEFFQRDSGLEGQHAAGEEAGENDDGQGADADGVHLGEGVGDVSGLGKEIADSPSGEQGVFLDGGNDALGVGFWGENAHAARCGTDYQMRDDNPKRQKGEDCRKGPPGEKIEAWLRP